MVHMTGPLYEYVELVALATFFFVNKIVICGLNVLITKYYNLSLYVATPTNLWKAKFKLYKLI